VTTTCAIGKTMKCPRIQAQALRAAGVHDDAVSVIPDEQEAITAALNMGQPGDLLLIFADGPWRARGSRSPSSNPPA